MDDAVFMGIYAAKQARSGVLPVQNECGLWQAWSMPDGNYMIQPLDAERQPMGALSLMDGREFMYVFDPMPTEIEYGEDENDDSILRADAPNLLARWYMQAVSDPPISLEYEDDLPTPDLSEDADALLEDAEPALTSPDILFIEDPSAQQGHGSTFQVHARKRPAVAPITRAGDPLLGPVEGYRRYLSGFAANDVSLRQEFAELIKDLHGGLHDPIADEKMHIFLALDLGDLPKQPHLYTEFGLALRREKQMPLALLAHQKALRSAPNDANIHFNIARTWYELGNYEEARKHLNIALQIAPEFETAHNFLLFLRNDAPGAAAG